MPIWRLPRTQVLVEDCVLAWDPAISRRSLEGTVKCLRDVIWRRSGFAPLNLEVVDMPEEKIRIIAHGGPLAEV